MTTRHRAMLLEMLARGMQGSGVLRLAQSLSERYVMSRSPAGHFAGFRRVEGPRCAVLCYHRVGSGGVPYYSQLDPRTFEAQISFLRRAYRIVSLDDMCRELDARGPSSQAVALTFDDGYRDLYTTAFPILRDHGVPATVYLTAAAIETGEVSWYDRIFALVMASRKGSIHLDGRFASPFMLSSQESRLQAASELVRALRRLSNQARIEACAALERDVQVLEPETKDRMLTWTQIREMQGGGISFGAHTMNHPVVSRLSPAEREHELSDSKSLLEERLQTPVTHFAYPFGTVSDIDAEACVRLPSYGYKSAVSTVWGLNGPTTRRHLLRRIGGEEPCLSLFAARLRWLFLCDEPGSAELQALEQAVLSLVSKQESAARKGQDLGAEVTHA